MALKNQLVYCHARLPNVGLGNKLFVWAKAFTFARLNNLPLVVTGWTQFQKAPLLAGGDLRLYWNYFRPVHEISLFSRWTSYRSANIIREPAINKLEFESGRPTIYEFSSVPHWSDYFRDVKAYHSEIRPALFDMLSTARRKELAQSPKPAVCLHVRTGDFRVLKENEDFKNVGNVRTPIDYFVQIIQGIRQIHGSTVPVTIVSDGTNEQLHKLLAMPGVKKGPRQTAIVDMLMMSSSKVLVPSAGSTFSYWSAFLSDSAVIMHPDHIHQSIRPASVNDCFYEGAATGSPNEWPELLRMNIRMIQS